MTVSRSRPSSGHTWRGLLVLAARRRLVTGAGGGRAEEAAAALTAPRSLHTDSRAGCIASPGMERRRRASIALTLNFLSLLFSVTAFCSSYWCQGVRRVPKPFCTGRAAEKAAHCIRYNNSDANGSSSSAVQYSWETGDDKFIERHFHAGIWYSCEENISGDGE